MAISPRRSLIQVSLPPATDTRLSAPRRGPAPLSARLSPPHYRCGGRMSEREASGTASHLRAYAARHRQDGRHDRGSVGAVRGRLRFTVTNEVRLGLDGADAAAGRPGATKGDESDGTTTVIARPGGRRSGGDGTG